MPSGLFFLYRLLYTKISTSIHVNLHAFQTNRLKFYSQRRFARKIISLFAYHLTAKGIFYCGSFARAGKAFLTVLENKVISFLRILPRGINLVFRNTLSLVAYKKARQCFFHVSSSRSCVSFSFLFQGFSFLFMRCSLLFSL